ncbi:MAG: lectin-like protein [Candidatus Rifleibacteriota bacterium]
MFVDTKNFSRVFLFLFFAISFCTCIAFADSSDPSIGRQFQMLGDTGGIQYTDKDSKQIGEASLRVPGYGLVRVIIDGPIGAVWSTSGWWGEPGFPATMVYREFKTAGGQTYPHKIPDDLLKSNPDLWCQEIRVGWAVEPYNQELKIRFGQPQQHFGYSGEHTNIPGLRRIRIEFSPGGPGVQTTQNPAATGKPATDPGSTNTPSNSPNPTTQPTTTAPTASDGQWKTFLGHRYCLTGVVSTWAEAESKAVSMGGHLAAIGCKAEQNWLWQTFGTEGKSLFFGLRRPSPPPSGSDFRNGWFWTNSEPMVMQFWGNGEPNNYIGTDECGMLFAPLQGYWADCPLTGWPEKAGFNGVVEVGPNDGLYPFNGHRYRLTGICKTWLEAREEAKKAGGDLVSIETLEENQWLNETFGGENLFIGLEKVATEADPAKGWRWVNGATFTPEAWQGAQFDNFQGKDICVMRNSGGQWFDTPIEGWPINAGFRGIIEVK